jgi:hypothetical protein
LNLGLSWQNQYSARRRLRCALFWDITQRRVVILYRRFGTTYRSQLQGLLDPRRWDIYVVPKRRYRITNLRCVIYQKIVDLIYNAA